MTRKTFSPPPAPIKRSLVPHILALMLLAGSLIALRALWA